MNFSKEFFTSNESKIYAEYNQIPLEEQTEKRGILFIGPSPNFKDSYKNKIFIDMFEEFSKEFCVMKIIFSIYDSEFFKKNEYPNVKYVRDASIAVDFFFKKFKCIKYFMVIGYSEGADIALHLQMRRPEISSFILISPTLSLKKSDFISYISVFKAKGMLIIGDKDEITSTKIFLQYIKFLQSKKMQIDFQIVSEANHYYLENFSFLLESVYNYINSLEKNARFNIITG